MLIYYQLYIRKASNDPQIYSLKNLNWSVLVVIEVNSYQKVLKGIHRTGKAIQCVAILFLILVVLYLMG